MTSFFMLSLILILSAITVCRAGRDYYSYHHTKPDVLCLNGGTSVSLPSGFTFCLCPDGYNGSSCEKEEIVSCYDGNGELYRGSVSRAECGRECLPWNSKRLHAIRRTEGDLYRRPHNKCRNPDHSSKPWCYVQTRFGIIKKHCDILRCTDYGADVSPVSSTVSLSGWQCGVKEERMMKVVGGALSTVKRHPWMAAVFTQRSQTRVFMCGGSLISPCWVLTAAHCFPHWTKTNKGQLYVFLGMNAINETDLQREQKFRVSEVIIHKNFDNTEGNFNNDIALLKIHSSNGECARESSSVKTVCIPDPELSLDDGTSCDVTGYGKEREGSWHYSRYLKETKVEVLSHDLCSSKTYYGNMMTDNMLCAGSKDWSTDSCKGDSGGPLVCAVGGRAFQFGVVSWGEGCSRKHRPGVYTKVSNYYHWILEKTGLSSLTATSAHL